MLPRTRGGEGILPSALAMVRMVGGAVFFQAAVLSFRKRRPSQQTSTVSLDSSPSRLKLHLTLLGLSALGIAINQALFLAGLRASTPFVAAILGATIPILTAALAVVFGKERPQIRTALGLLLALVGVLWLVGVGERDSNSLNGTSRGVLILALNCLSYSAYVVFSRDVVRSIGTARTMAWVFTYGALLFTPWGLAPLLETMPALTTRGIMLVAYVVLVPTILAYGLNAWALSRTTASVVTIYIYLQPLFAGVLARLQLGDSVSGRAGLAALLILGGVAVTTLRRRS